jgi:hypothetical protein
MAQMFARALDTETGSVDGLHRRMSFRWRVEEKNRGDEKIAANNDRNMLELPYYRRDASKCG